MSSTNKTYAFAIVPTQGRYSSGNSVRVTQLSNDLDAARKIAKLFSASYQSGMRPYGGSSGGYRVIAWGSSDRTISGYSLDRTPDAR